MRYRRHLPRLALAVEERTTQAVIALVGHGRAGIPELLDLIEKSLESSSVVCDMIIPYTAGNVLNELNQCGVIMQTEYLPEGTRIRVKCSERDAAKYAAYQI